jgi:hypothetical protein
MRAGGTCGALCARRSQAGRQQRRARARARARAAAAARGGRRRRAARTQPPYGQY